MRLWAMVLAIALASGSASADVFQNVNPGDRFAARVAKVVPHVEDAGGRFVGYLHALDGQAWVLTAERRLVQVSVDGFVEAQFHFESADCSGEALISRTHANGGGGGFMPHASVHGGVVYEAVAEFTWINYRSMLWPGEACYVLPGSAGGTLLAPAAAVEVLDFTPPFELR